MDLLTHFQNLKVNNYWATSAPQVVTDLDAIASFLNGDTATVPQLQPSGLIYIHDLFQFEPQVFSYPLSPLDERLCQLVAQSGLWYSRQNNGYWTGGLHSQFIARLQASFAVQKGLLPIIFERLVHYGLDDKEVMRTMTERLVHYLFEYVDKQSVISETGEFIWSMMPKYSHVIVNAAATINNPYYISELFIRKEKEGAAMSYVDEFLPVLLTTSSHHSNGRELNVPHLRLYVEYDAKRFEAHFKEEAKKITASGNLFNVMSILAKALPESFPAQPHELAYTYLDSWAKYLDGNTSYYVWEETHYDYESKLSEPMSTYAIGQVLKYDREKGKAYATEYLIKYNKRLKDNFVKRIDEVLGEECVPILGECLDVKNPPERSFLRYLLGILGKYDYSAYHERVWAFTQSSVKSIREIVCIALSRLGESAIPRAKTLLHGSKADTRQAGALLLSLINTDETKALLAEALNNEKNDDARDIMLVSLGDALQQPQTVEAAKQVIASAVERKKLDKPVVEWLNEATLPPLYWTNGEALDANAIRFVFYRQMRAKEIRPELELKPILALIDNTKSSAFAKEVLAKFKANGEDSKFKMCLLLAGVLGNEDIAKTLQSLIRTWAEESRGKMAEYAVQALAMEGSNKSLRVVETLSRKYKNKNKNIGAAALQAFVVAAEELGITPYELADSIIPDFDFNGIYKTFTVGEDEYRAFIDNDFKIVYYDEKGKKLKSPPKGTPTELQNEFKEIGKEVRDIAKSQADRLEQYLVTQRRWESEAWQKFFLQNPIMFVYGMKLVWGAYDEQGNLMEVFRCLEDQTLETIDYEEVDVTAYATVGMVHPLSMSKELVSRWVEEGGVETIFPQLQRPIHTLAEADYEIRISKQFDGRKVNALSFASQMDKLGWHRGSVVDGGMVSGFHKVFASLGIEAYLETDGIFMGYYDYDDAKTGSLMFVKKGSIAIGSYTYDSPSETKDERLFAFKDVPAIVYSEIIADLEKVAPEAKADN